MKKIFIYFFVLTHVCAFAQQASFEPTNLGSNINSEYAEISPILSPDEKTLYFIRVNHPQNKFGKHGSQDIWYSQKQEDGTWGEAKRLEDFYNNGQYSAILGMTQDGRQMLVYGLFTKSGRVYAPGLSLLTISNNKVVDMDKLKIGGFNGLQRGREINGFFSRDGKYIFIASSKRAYFGGMDIYCSEFKDGYWSRFTKIKNISHRQYSEESPMLSLDGKTLYFSSSREGAVGNYDIYKSEKIGPGIQDWSTPELLEGKTNSTEYESYFYVNNKQTMAYYASTLNSMGKTDIFKIKLKEEKPYVVFKGKIINSFTRKALTDKKDYQITVNGLPKDSIKINYDSAKFEIHFPFGAKYSIIPSLKYYKGDTLYKDYSQVKEFKVDTGTLYLDPFKYVTVKGILIQANNGALLPYNESTVVYLDGQDIRTLPNLKADVQLLRSAFNVNLLWGKKYVLQYQSPKFETEADTLDLTNIQEFKEVQVQLKGTRIKEVAPVLAATVTGTVINQKTGKPLTGKSSFQIWVNESPNETTTYDPETGKYSLVLPLGNAYLLNPKLERFISTSEFINLTNEKVSIKIYKDLLLAPIEVGQAIRMENIFFASGKAILDPKSYPELDRFANILKENKFLKVEIAGHTDNVGDPAKNMQLSRWRARAVLLYLQDKGVPVEQATFNGYGQTKPVADNKTPKGRALNRRVEFVIKDID